jgi:hypothetical protein
LPASFLLRATSTRVGRKKNFDVSLCLILSTGIQVSGAGLRRIALSLSLEN